MAQHDMVIDNGPGLTVRTDINAAIQALVSCSSGAVEPATKYPGQLWLDTTVPPNGAIRQRNQANNAWIEPRLGPTPTQQTYSRVVNGAMQISQENGDTASAGAASGSWYCADQFLGTWSLSAGTVACARNSVLLPDGTAKVASLVTGAAVTSLAAASILFFVTRIEGVRVTDLQWGTAQAKQIILRFSTSVPAGTYSVALQNSDQTRSYVAQWTQASAAWQTNTLVIPGDTTGAWLKDTGVGIHLAFTWAMGANFVGVTGWQAGSKYTAAGQVTSIAAGAGFYLTNVGLYADPSTTGVPPPWQMPDYASELAACKRYIQKLRMDLVATAGGAGQYYGATYPFPVEMRTAPALNTGTDGTPTNVASTAFDSAATTMCRNFMSSTAGGTFGISGRTGWANARM